MKTIVKKSEGLNGGWKPSSSFPIRSPSSSFMLLILFSTGVTAGLPVSGDSLALWQCGGVQPERQVFSYSISAGPLQFHFTVNGTQTNNPPLVWDISGPSNNTGTPIHVWGSYPQFYPSQQWSFSADSKQIISNYNSMCVGVDITNGPNIGSAIGIYPCNSSDPLQLWTLDAINGTVSLITSSPSLCIQAGNNTPSCDMFPFTSYPYCNPELSISSRLTDLLSRMSPADMARAMDSSIPAIPRLGTPSMGSGEALHGAATGCLSVSESNNTGCPTSFPCPMALGASFDTSLWENVGLAIGMESRALYNAGAGSIWLFAPNINPCRESRWGRCQEVPSEDSTVVSHYATNFISGLQGKGGPDPRYLLAASTAKHFIAYDLEGFIPRTDPLPRPPTGTCDTPGGCQRWNFDASPRPEDLSGYYSPPFQAAIAAGVRSIMCAYSGIYGQPSCATDLIQSILRPNASSWDGHVVSDATAIELMGDSKWDDCKPPYPPLTCTPEPFNSHNYTHTVGETALASLNAGVDVNLGPFYHQWLEALVSNGTVPLSALETSVSRIYTTAIKLGLLDPKVGQVYPNLPPSTVDSPEHRQLALLAAQESIVLLSNKMSLLPLSMQANTKIAFIGPHANSTQSFLSNYHGTNQLVNSHSPLQVALARGYDVTYSLGCNICDVIPPGFPNMPCTKASDTSGIASAAAVAAAADVAVLFIGADQTSEAENFDRNEIGLQGVQEQLAQAVLAAQPKTIIVLISGGIISSQYIVENAPALIYSFYPGELGGDALIDVITGAYNPGGKLPVTMYYPNITSSRDIRDMDLSSGQGITHSYFKGPVLFPFGAGISYTTWEYTMSKMMESEDDQVLTVRKEDLLQRSSSSVNMIFKVSIRNSGQVAGDCVVFAFINREKEERGEETEGPFRSLMGFTRLRNVQPSVEKEVEFDLSDAMRAGSALAVYNKVLDQWEPRTGAYRVIIGDVTEDAAIRYLRVV